MKNKPVSHKNENTFRFQTFAERIKNINIDVVHRIQRVSQLPEEADSFFAETLQKWHDLNYTEDFEELQKELGDVSDVQSLAQVVHKQKYIIETLKTSLQKPNNLALDATLELVVALARDLQYEFYPYFPDVFHCIINLLSTKDTEILERLFTCLAYLFKTLWRYMISDIENVYALFSPLIGSDQKEYIRNFAAECVSFLMRKVPDKIHLFTFIFCKLDEHPERVDGVGQLLFEMVKGVNRQFHSCTAGVLKTLFELLGKGVRNDTELPWEMVKGAIMHASTSMMQHTCKEQVAVVWDVLNSLVCLLHEKFITNENDLKGEIELHLQRVLEIYNLWINYKHGALIRTDESVVLTVLKVLKDVPERCISALFETIASILTSRYVEISPYDLKMLMQKVFVKKIPYNVIFNFVRRVFGCRIFDKEIVSPFLNYCEELLIDDFDGKIILKMLTELIMFKQPFPYSADKMLNKCLLGHSSNIASNNQNSGSGKLVRISSYVSSVLETASNDVENQVCELWAAAIIAPHLENSNKRVYEHLKTAISKLLNHVQKSDKVSTDVLFVLAYSFLSLQQFDIEAALNLFSEEVFVDLLKQYPTEIPILQLVNFVLGLKDKPIKNLEVFDSIFSIVYKNLGSPYHMVRLLTLQMLSTFDLPLRETEDDMKVRENVFQVCLHAEKIPTTIQDFREKQRILQKLSYQEVQKFLPVGDYDAVPLLYLIGNLYINFQLLWEPVEKLIETHARGLRKTFWETFIPQLQNSMNKGFCNDKENLLNLESNVSSNDCPLALFYQEKAQEVSQFSDRPDFTNHLCLLWKCVALFPDVAEPRGRDLVPLILNTINNEYFTIKPGFVAIQDIRKCTKTRKSLGTKATEDKLSDSSKKCHHTSNENEHGIPVKKIKLEETVNVEMLDEDEEDESDVEVKKRSKNITKVLLAQLSVLSKFQNPKSLFREKELRNAYMQLLTDRHPNVQKLAFDCIATYKHKFINPYKENFYRLLDDKTFKTEVTLFSVDADNGVVLDEHRDDLFPMLMRILYGKMISKTGNSTSGKALAGVRRSIVLRFLAGCKESELQMFVDLIFNPFKHHLILNPKELVEKIDQTLNLSAVLPLRRQLSSLNLLGVFMKHLGNLAPGLLPQLLKILLSVAMISQKCLDKRDELDVPVISRLKSIRSLSFQKLIHFFTNFESYPFSVDEIEAIFATFIWPLLTHIDKESLYSPSPLLRLLSTWCENPRYFPLLFKQVPDHKSQNVLSRVIALYSARQTQPIVLTTITEMLHNLLTLQDHGISSNDSQALPLTVPAFADGHDSEEKLNLGTKLLLPYVPDILKRLHKELEKNVKTSKKPLGSPEMKVLSLISVHVKNSEQSTEVVHLLLKCLSKTKGMGEQLELSTLKSIEGLIKQVDKPQQFLVQIAPLFSSIQNRHSRSELCLILEAISLKDECCKQLSDIVYKMNAWDPKLLEDPDYITRLEGYRLAREYILDSSSLSKTDTVLIIMYNCCFFVRTLDDLSLRDGAVFVLQKMCPFFQGLVTDSHSDAFKTLILDGLLPEVQKGLKEKSETVRKDFIQILAAVVRHCNSHPEMKDLFELCDPDADTDFWENICHIQLHRRARAMTRFARGTNEGKLNIPPVQLTSFLMPIVTSFLFDKSYVKHTNLIDASIEAIGAICQKLPWHRYEAILRYYLGLLTKNVEYHKTVVKIVVCVLNAFHFDLKNSRGITAEVKLPLNKKKADKDDVTTTQEIEEMDVDKADQSLEIKEVTMSEALASGKTILNENQATKVHCIIAKSILPELHKALTEKMNTEEEHKLTKRVFAEDEEINRIPIAVAMVKLLEVLPHGMLEENLPGVLLRICDFLKSRAESIREAARETLVKIMTSIGPRYFWYLLREMRGVMTKGYQVHVMLYTINTVLTHLCDQLKPGDLDSSVKMLSELCHQELFSTVSEEKEVGKILGKLKEARTSKSYIIYQTTARFLTDASLPEMLRPLQDKLSITHSHKMMRKIQECLQKMVLGLADNTGIKPEQFLMYIYRLITSTDKQHSLSQIKSSTKTIIERNPDVYLLPKEPPRGSLPAKSSKKANDHIIVEFAFRVLHFLLKRNRFSIGNKEHLEMLDPFVPLLAEHLTSQYVKLVSTILRCIAGLLHFPLPSFRDHMFRTTQELFVLLKKHAGTGLAQGENFEMVVMCFKTLTIIIRDIKYHMINEEQLQVLLVYIEQDIYDHTRQATAFTLLKAILSRKLESPELLALMKKIAETAVTSEIDHIRVQCRQAYLQYLLDYPHGKRLRGMIVFLVSQLEYQVVGGRESVLELINSIINVFPPGILNLYSGLLFVPIASRLVNDISPQCRKLAAQGIKKLISRIDEVQKDQLMSVVTTWITDIKIAHRRLGAQLCGFFAETEGESFQRHLKAVLPAIQQQLDPEKYKDQSGVFSERNTDHLLYHLLNTLLKIFVACPIIRDSKYTEILTEIWKKVRLCLLYPHAWVRLVAGQLFGLMFAQYSVSDLCSLRSNNSSEYLLQDCEENIRGLSADFCSQLRGAHLVEGLGDQIAKNLVYLGKVALKMSIEDENSETSEEENKMTCFDWLLRQMCREATGELIKSPRITVRRDCVLKWFAAIAMGMEKEVLLKKLPKMLTPLCRMLNDNSSEADPALKTLAQEVVDVLKSLVGTEMFVEMLSNAETALSKMRAKRKKERAIQAVADPSKAARRKIKKHEKKQQAKKRKLTLKKGKRPAKKTKKS